MAAPLDAEENERFSSLALFFVLFPLIISFLTSYYLKIKRITAVHETIVGLFAGMIVGAIATGTVKARARDVALQ